MNLDSRACSTEPWACYLTPELWPLSADKLFLGQAVMLIGEAVCAPWDDRFPSWMNNTVLPGVPTVDDAFDTNKKPIDSVHRAWAEVVRSVKSPSAFVAERLTGKQWVQDCVSHPDGGEPLPALLLRAQRGEDLSDPVSHEHWEYVSLLTDCAREELFGAEARMALIARTLQQAALDGQVLCSLRQVGGSTDNRREMPQSWWELDDPLLRVARCAVNIETPLDSLATATHWIFVERSTLMDYLPALEQTEFFDPGPPPAKAPSYSTQISIQVSEALIKLFKSLRSDQMRQMTKDDFRCRISDRRGLPIPEKSWREAWRQATVDFPELRRAGRR